MTVVILDYPPETASCPQWEHLSTVATVHRYPTTSLPELLIRSRNADVLVTWAFPFRREILDYITHTRLILVPDEQIQSMVELPIADQLGILVRGFPSAPASACDTVSAITTVIEKM